MGICFSKKKGTGKGLPSSPPPNPISNDPPDEKRREAAAAPGKVPAVSTTAEKKPVFVITKNPAAEDKDKKKKEEEPPKKPDMQDEDTSGGGGGGAAAVGVREHRPVAAPVPMRTSSCSKEEVDAILIQCGRLSRSSSGNAGGGGHRRYSGSKRSYDFDNDKRGDDEEWEKTASRPSPHRRTPGRERDGGGEGKRSGSRERGSSGGGRRVSRSPGRRSEGPPSSVSTGDKPKQPGKMVSVPAREKGSSSEVGVKRASTTFTNKKGASPRSRSPANTTRVSNESAQHQPQSLSRSSSRKAEQSPYRRNPMAEIDDNTLRAEQQCASRNQKPIQSQPQKERENSSQMSKSDQKNFRAAEIPNGIKGNTTTISSCVRDQLMGCRAKEQQPEPEIVEEASEMKGASKGSEVLVASTGVECLIPRTITRTRSSRRSSRDMDHALGVNQDALLNPSSYNSLLLEDIQNYHQQKNTAFSLPACISKACSILEAVADLNSFSDNRSYGAEGSDNDNGRYEKRSLARKEPFVESEKVMKNDLMEPSLHKYVTVRGMGAEMEPQESAGSNSFVGQPWASPWEHNSVDSTDRYWTSRSDNNEEMEEEEEEEEQSLSEATREFDARGRRLRLPGSRTNSAPATKKSSGGKKKEFDHRQLHHSGGNGKVGGRALSLPIAAAASS